MSESHPILPSTNCPLYAKTGKVYGTSAKSIITEDDEIRIMKKACSIASRVLSAVGKLIKVRYIKSSTFLQNC